MRLCSLAAAVVVGLVAFAPVQANQTVETCVFDIIGSSGDQFRLMQEFALTMREQGIRFNLRPFTDENVAMAEFSAGSCDVLVATDLRTRRFNRFSGTLSALGGVTSYDELRTIMGVIASDNAASHMANDEYEVLGVFPLGAGYLFVADRNINTAADLAGKRIATLEYQQDAIHMVNFVNGSVEPSDVTNFGGKFNNRSVDAAYAPAYAYEALELYRGVGDDGGIVRYPLSQLTAQIIARKGVLNGDIAQKSRQVAFDMFDDTLAQIKRFEADIPTSSWVDIPEADIDDYQEMFRQNRIQLRDGVDSAGNSVAQVYDGDMLTLMRRVRCRQDGSASECTASDRE